MKKLLQKLSQVRLAHSTQYSVLRSDTPEPVGPTKQRSDVPQGHFPVYVGTDQKRRFVVSAEMLRQPIFVELLNRSAQEYGYDQKGVLRIPINVVVFERVLESLRQGLDLSCLDEML